MAKRADVSMLFDLFVAAQRVRRVLADGMAKSGLRPDEYAVYSLLFEHGPLTATEMSELLGMPLTTVLDYLKAMGAAGHLERTPHPSDGRALQLRLSRSGIAAQKRANTYWNAVRTRLEGGLPMSIDQVRRALQALDEAAVNASAGTLGTVRARPIWVSFERARLNRRDNSVRHGKARGSARLTS
jgi:DNA-binding MarR family transcriptional regulator